MHALRVRLVGRFSAYIEGQVVEGLESSKVQELFSYLLLFRNRPHSREALADLLWDASSTAQSKKYLRQAVWQLTLALRSSAPVSALPLRTKRIWNMHESLEQGVGF